MDNEDKKYNGWRNYATWRVQLEIVDDYFQGMLEGEEDWLKEQREMSVGDMANCIEDIVEETVFHVVDPNGETSLADDYARAFLQDVDYYELAEHGLEFLSQEYENSKVTA